jgi:hypothetical protein
MAAKAMAALILAAHRPPPAPLTFSFVPDNVGVVT